MNKRGKTALVPRLRFPEFKSEKQWRVVSLIDTVDKTVKWSFTGGPFGSNLKSSDYKNIGIRIIQLQNIGDAEFINNYKIFTSNEKANELISCNIYPDEIIMSKMGDPVGRACIIPNFHTRYLMCSDGIRLVINEKYYSKYFIYSLINSEFFRSTIESHSTGSTRKRIGLEVLKNLQMTVPEESEQQKIADCLSSLDDLIIAEGKKLDAYKAHKKGLMQKLFPAEGKNVPELRFSEFRDSGEWSITRLGQLLKIGNGKDYKHLNTGDIPVYGSGGYMTSVENFLYDGESVCIGRKGTIDKPMFLTGKFWTVDTLFYTHSFNSCLPKFAYIIFQNINWLKHNEAGGIPSLSKINIEKIEIFSTSLPEQEKIADCLSSIDDLITAQAEKVEALKAHKKGLMQGLFPAVEEVGG